MRVSIIVAVAENSIIGREGVLPWRLPNDLRRFKRLTMGHAVVMGRRTFEAIGRPLPGRQNIVLSRRPAFAPAGVEVAHSFPAALALAHGEEAFVVGGEAVFRFALPLAGRVHLTLVHAEVEGDVRFPLEELAVWRLVSDERHGPDLRHAFAYSFRRYERG